MGYWRNVLGSFISKSGVGGCVSTVLFCDLLVNVLYICYFRLLFSQAFIIYSQTTEIPSKVWVWFNVKDLGWALGDSIGKDLG